MKKLNRKGFTLIELLAVIVIMAIILIVTVPNIINSISDARVNSIHNLAKSAANTYDTIVAQDMVSTGTKKIVGTTEEAGSDWECITVNLATTLGLTDVVIDDELSNTAYPSTGFVGTAIESTDCSAIRVVNGQAEIVLVAAAAGKFNVSGKTVYAYSKDATGVSQ